jgi:hypothetical protein
MSAPTSTPTPAAAEQASQFRRQVWQAVVAGVMDAHGESADSDDPGEETLLVAGACWIRLEPLIPDDHDTAEGASLVDAVLPADAAADAAALLHRVLAPVLPHGKRLDGRLSAAAGALLHQLRRNAQDSTPWIAARRRHRHPG